MITNDEIYDIADKVRDQSVNHKSWKRKNIEPLAPLKEIYGAALETTPIVITPDNVEELSRDICNYYMARIDAAFSEGFFTAMEMVRDGKIKITRREKSIGCHAPKTAQLGSSVYIGYDLIGAFLKDRCEMGAAHSVNRDLLYLAFCRWYANHYEDSPMTARSFYQVIRNRGFMCKSAPGGRCRCYIGLGLKAV